MKRKKLLKYLTESGCYCLKEGGEHSIFLNPATRAKTTIPRHAELNDFLAEKICKQLGLTKIKRGK